MPYVLARVKIFDILIVVLNAYKESPTDLLFSL